MYFLYGEPRHTISAVWVFSRLQCPIFLLRTMYDTMVFDGEFIELNDTGDTTDGHSCD